MRETLLQLDRALSLSINFFHSEALDVVMASASERLTWLPLYAFLAFLLHRKFGWKSLFVVAVMTAVSILLTDQISVFMKDHFMRLRPCHQEGVMEMLRTPEGCGGTYGFVSSHAANTMGVALLLSMLLKQAPVTWLMLLYALLNGYSRIYLGKHYVFDVIGGYALGLVVAVVCYRIVLLIFQRLNQR